MVTWIRLPDLPFQYYHEIALTSIGDYLGKTIKIDKASLNAERGQFARIAIEIDTALPLVPSVEIDDWIQTVEYEGLPTICYNCGKILHGSASCSEPPAFNSAVQEIPKENLQSSGNEKPVENNLKDGGVAGKNEGLGPWMVAQRSRRRPIRLNERVPDGRMLPKEGRVQDGSRTNGSRFNALADETDSDNSNGKNDTSGTPSDNNQQESLSDKNPVNPIIGSAKPQAQ